MVSLYWVKEYLDVWAKYINWIAGLQPTTTVCIALKSVCYKFCQLNMACLRILLLLLLSRYYSTVCMRHDCVDWLSTKWGKLLSFNIEVTYPSMVMSDITMSIFVELKITYFYFRSFCYYAANRLSYSLIQNESNTLYFKCVINKIVLFQINSVLYLSITLILNVRISFVWVKTIFIQNIR